MYLNDDYKIERFDGTNISLFKKVTNGNEPCGFSWKPIRYYPTFQDAIRDSIVYLTLDKIKYAGSVSRILREISGCMNHIDCIAEKLALQIENEEEENEY